MNTDHSFGSAVSSRQEQLLKVVYTIINDVVTREGSQTLILGVIHFTFITDHQPTLFQLTYSYRIKYLMLSLGCQYRQWKAVMRW